MELAVRFVEANRIRYAYHQLGEGPLVLCLHGFPDTPHTWSDLLPALARAGYRAVAPFLRGYPPSGAPADDDYGMLALAHDLVALVKALGNGGPASVVGHDWGAFAAYGVANLAPELVRRLVTVAIPHPRSLAPTPSVIWGVRHFIAFQFRTRAAARLARDDFAQVEAIYRRWSPDWRATAEDLAPVKRCLAEPGAVENALGYYVSFRRDALGARGREIRALLRARTSVPTLTFVGEHDGALAPRHFEATPACFTGPYEMARVPNAGHFLHREDPTAFLAKTLEFLARNDPPRSSR